MKQTAVLLCVLFCVSGVLAVDRAPTYFLSAFGPAQGDSSGQSIIQTADGGYLCAGSYQSGYNDDIGLIKLMADGTPQWGSSWRADTEHGFDLTRTYDGGSVLVGLFQNYNGSERDGVVIRSDSNGFKEWFCQLHVEEATSEMLFAVTETADQGLVVGGTMQDDSGDENLFLVKLTETGTVVWGVISMPEEMSAVKDIVETATGDLVIVGYAGGEGSKNAVLQRYTSAGTLLWTRTLGSGSAFAAVTMTSDGGIAAAGTTSGGTLGDGEILLARYDGTGSLIWQRGFGTSQDEWAGGVVETPDLGFIVCGASVDGSSGNQTGVQLKCDSAGMLTWSYRTLNTQDTVFNGVENTSDGGLITVGTSVYYGPSTSSNILFMKTDAAGQIPNCMEVTDWIVSEETLMLTTGTPSASVESVTVTESENYYGFQHFLPSGDEICWYDPAPVTPTPVPTVNPEGVIAAVIKTGDLENGEWVDSCLTTSDNGYLMAGKQSITGSDDDDFLLLKYSDPYTIEWGMTLGGTGDDRAEILCELTDGSFVFSGESDIVGYPDYLLVKVSSSGVPIWARGGSTDLYDFVNDIQGTSDGGFIVTGDQDSPQENDGNAYLLKYDAAGNLIWAKSYDSGIEEAGYKLIESGSEYIVCGNARNSETEVGAALLFKTDLLGSLTWSRTYTYSESFSIRDMHLLGTGGYIVTGFFESITGPGAFIMQMDSAGTPVWAREFSGVQWMRTEDVCPVSDGGFLVTGGMGIMGDDSERLCMVKFSSDGTLLWSKQMTGGTSSEGITIKELSPGQYLFTGTADYFDSFSSDIVTVLTDSDGNVTDCPYVEDLALTVSPFTPTVATPALTASILPITESTESVGYDPINLDPEIMCAAWACVNHGDVDDSGTLTAGDAQDAFEITLGLMTPTAEETCAADCNASGNVTAGDALNIFQAVLGSASCVDPIP